MPSSDAQDALRSGVRALLMSPLLSADHPEFASIRRHAQALRDWFQRETGWLLTVDREWARLYKRPAVHDDASRGLPDFDRRRYVVFCLVCALLDRTEVQITLQDLGERLLQAAADPALVDSGFTFGLRSLGERRELVAVCRALMKLGVLQRVAGDEDRYANEVSAPGDALYDIHRRPLAALLAAVRGPSTWPAEAAPTRLADRLDSLVNEHVADSDEGRRTAVRHHLARRLLDDPVVYLDSLDEEARPYFANQRGPLATRLCEASGLVAEQRAEGLALVDETGELTDLAMPAEGTDAHVTLIAAEFLAAPLRDGRVGEQGNNSPIREEDVTDHLREVRDRLGRYWRRSAREVGSERELTAIALERLARLQLIRRDPDGIRPLPALARFALGEAAVVTGRRPRGSSVTGPALAPALAPARDPARDPDPARRRRRKGPPRSDDDPGTGELF